MGTYKKFKRKQIKDEHMGKKDSSQKDERKKLLIDLSIKEEWKLWKNAFYEEKISKNKCRGWLDVKNGKKIILNDCSRQYSDFSH